LVAHPPGTVRGSDTLGLATTQPCATKPRRPAPCRSRPRASAAPLSVVRPFALASNESSDTCVLPFASQINHALSTPAYNRPFEAEVIFCVQGAITDPCPVPLSLTVTIPSSRTPALSHFWIRRMMRRSPTRCSTNLMSHSWLTVSKESVTYYPSPQPFGFGDDLLGRCLIPQPKPAADEESFDATDPAYSRTSRSCATNPGVSRTSPSGAAEPTARRRSTRRGSQHSGPLDHSSRQSRRTDGDDG